MKTLFSALTSPINLRSGRRTCLRNALMLGCVLAVSLFAPALAHADAVVTEPTEAALDAALAQVAKGGTITFACDGTIPITNTKKITAVSTTSPTVTLDATGHNITLDGGGKTTLFSATGHIQYNPIEDVNIRYRASIVFKSLTLTNSAGRAVSANLGNVTASNCAFTNNGGIVVTGGNLNATNCSFTNNTAASGGAAQGSNGSMTASYCTFVNNVASSGGALQGSSLIVTSHCAFLNNRATNGNGGAICNTVNGVSLSDSVFAGNSAEYPGTGASGGAVYYGGRGGANTITRCAFLNNAVSASDASIVTGGALMADGPSSPTSITNCTFVGNRAAGGGAAAGGAIYFISSMYGEPTTVSQTARFLETMRQAGRAARVPAAAFTTTRQCLRSSTRLSPTTPPARAATMAGEPSRMAATIFVRTHPAALLLLPASTTPTPTLARSSIPATLPLPSRCWQAVRP